MKYGRYKNEDAFLNAKLHALSATITGDGSLLEQEIQKVLDASPGTIRMPLKEGGSLSVKLLSLDEKRKLYATLKAAADNTSGTVKEARTLAGAPEYISVNQRKALVAIMAYQLKWKPAASFNYILSSCPEVKNRLKPKELAGTVMPAILSNLYKHEADLVIKRLVKLQETNKKKGKQWPKNNTK